VSVQETSLEERLLDAALGRLDPAAQAEFDALCARDPAVKAAFDALVEALATQPAALPPAPVRPEATLRLLDAVDSAARHEGFADRLAAAFDLIRQRMLEVLSAIPDPRRWTEGFPGVSLFHFEGGPNVPYADVGLVRFAPNVVFPMHRHLGDELFFVLEGTYEDLTAGGVHGPGSQVLLRAGTAHTFRVGPSGVLVATGQSGFEFVPES
jgi:anti-sigma factor ChrR (cupin superfamily)